MDGDFASAGDTETGKVLRWEFDTEPEAMNMVDRRLRTDSAGQWREQHAGGATPRRQRRYDRCSSRPDPTAEQQAMIVDRQSGD
ncbi:hypothetical protein ABZ783_35990 [Micromonospora sp. NPDC047738]|uniref:hypothetical protein n=1 Tax=Micromonospora sp. NPDC047738 TaxID=3155741 RepID=UPI003410D73A